MAPSEPPTPPAARARGTGSAIGSTSAALAADLEAEDGAIDFPFPDPTAPVIRGPGTRGAIITEARRQFAVQGLQKTRLAAIARAAWVAPSTVSLHFNGKRALFAACLDEEVAMLFARTDAAVEGHPYPHISGDYMRIMGVRLPGYPLLRAVLVHSPGTWGTRFYNSPSLERAVDDLVVEIETAQNAGLVRGDVVAREVGLALGPVVAGTLWPVALREESDPRLLERALLVMRTTLFSPLSAEARLDDQVRPWRERQRAIHVARGGRLFPPS